MPINGIVVALPSHSYCRILGVILNAGYCLCEVLHVLLLSSHVSSGFYSFLALSQYIQYIYRDLVSWIASRCEWLCEYLCAWCLVMNWCPIICKFSHLVPSVTRIGIGSTPTLTRIKCILNMNEYCISKRMHCTYVDTFGGKKMVPCILWMLWIVTLWCTIFNFQE